MTGINAGVMTVSAAAGDWASLAAGSEPGGGLSGGLRRPGVGNPWDGDAETTTEGLGGGMDGELIGCCPQVELAAGGVALEAAVAIAYQIGPELAALAAPGLVDRARAAEPAAVTARGDEAQQRQDLLDGDL